MEKRLLWVGGGILGLLLLVAALAFWQARPDPLRGTRYDPPLSAPPIALNKADGQPFHLAGLKGKITLLFFGYTSCPDVCPTTLAELQQAISMLKDVEQTSVEVVFISVDPDRDTPQRVQDYVSHFNPAFIGLSGSLADLEPIWQAYGIYRQIEQTGSASGYTVSHTARIFLIDQDGNLRLTYGFQTPPQDVAHDLQLLLRAKK
ncbi:MAG: SCO family protein [Anaerolineae bacterium]